MNVADTIRTKRAVRQFRDERLPEEAVRAILNAGRRAQSSKNSQPWRFLAIQEPQTLKELSRLGKYAGHIAGAALAVMILTPTPEQRFSIMFDAGQAAAYMRLAAWEMGIGSCLVSIYEPEKARELLGFPDEWHLRLGISFGYPEDVEALSAPPQPGGRKDFEELIHWEGWQG